jgi:NADH-quinone oxidoreductase subunit C
MTSTPTPAASARPGDGGVALVAGARAAQVLSSRLPPAVLRREEAFGEETVVVAREHLVEAVTLLRDDPDAAYAVPLCVLAVDFPDREPRFDVVYQLRSLQHNDVARLIVQVTEDDPSVPSLERVMPGFDWHERETFDLSGIVFTGHHDLRRILMPDDWEGHPLRKDYVSFGEPVAFTHNITWALPQSERPDDMPGGMR